MTDHKILFSTDRLTLRYFNEESDSQIFFDYRNDKDNGKYQGWPYPFTNEHLKDFFDQMKTRDLSTIGDWVQIALVENDSGEIIGDCAFNNGGKTAEVGITIRQECQRKGYAKEGLTALLRLLFNQCQVHRVTAYIDKDNIGSKKLMESLGMRQEGYFIQSYWDEKVDEWRDEYFFALLNDEFVSSN